jgi:hypothetical protein
VPDAASDSLNATPVLKLSYHLSPQRKQLQGCHGELLSPATDDLASIERQVAMYHLPIVPLRVPSSGRVRHPRSKFDHRQTIDRGHLQQLHLWSWPEPNGSSDRDDDCGRHRLPADIAKQGTQASLNGLPLADTRIVREIRPTNSILSN